jgi:hypothetical protein
MRLCRLLLIAILLGCAKPSPPLSGTWSQSDPAASLTLDGKTFTLKIGTDLVEGETSQVKSFLALHPKTFNGSSEEEATQRAFKEAQEQGKMTDMEVLGSVFEPVRCTVSADNATIEVEKQKLLSNNKEPFYYRLGTLRRVP